MKLNRVLAAVLGLLVSASCLAAAPAGAPAGSTALCKDGSYYSGAEKKGACRGHKGVKDWFGAAPAAAAASMAEPPKPAAAASTPAAPGAAAGATRAAPAATGTGMVWANTDSKVYHCPGSRWYGKTKKGEYMTQADATAKGLRPDHGKACQ
ncbi:MAG: DUF3761 domain-containing protein [Rhodocyclaceae bacterium]|nr:DUF3761 domain-containing protein [Rhodocyclaceae bacterium]